MAARVGYPFARIHRMIESHSLEIVPVQMLDTRLRLAAPIDYPPESLRRPLADGQGDVDDSPILRYLFRSFRPRRTLNVAR